MEHEVLEVFQTVVVHASIAVHREIGHLQLNRLDKKLPRHRRRPAERRCRQDRHQRLRVPEQSLFTAERSGGLRGIRLLCHRLDRHRPSHRNSQSDQASGRRLSTLDGSNNPLAGTVDGTSRTGVALSAVMDGASNTFAVIEDAGRLSPASVGTPYYTPSTFFETFTGTLSDGDVTDAPIGGVPAATGSLRAAWRWADPDAGGSGISGPANARGFLDASGKYAGKMINQNDYPIGGTPAASQVDSSGDTKGLYPQGERGCPWTTQNCGANDEPFSFHSGGCQVVMLDGSVRFLNEDLDPPTMRSLVTRSEGVPVNVN